ncbi:hypothetical protein [Archangium sp.]|jgi:hypothetical protein
MASDPVTLVAALRNTLEDTLQRVQEASRRREEAIRALIAWLG